MNSIGNINKEHCSALCRANCAEFGSHPLKLYLFSKTVVKKPISEISVPFTLRTAAAPANSIEQDDPIPNEALFFYFPVSRPGRSALRAKEQETGHEVRQWANNKSFVNLHGPINGESSASAVQDAAKCQTKSKVEPYRNWSAAGYRRSHASHGESGANAGVLVAAGNHIAPDGYNVIYQIITGSGIAGRI